MTKQHIDIAALAIDRSALAENNQHYLLKTLVIITILILFAIYYLNINSTTAQVALQTNSINSGTAMSKEKNIASINLLAQSSSTNNNTVLAKDKTPNNANTLKVLDASGYIVARRVATVSSRITGKLVQLYIEEGQKVFKNQILAELDDEKAKISYQLALAELSAKQANVGEAKISLRYQQQRLHRNKELSKQKLISQQLIDNSEVKTAQIKAQLLNKIALVELAQQQVDLALYQLNNHKIRAPFNGVMISKNAQVGEIISTGASDTVRSGIGTLVDMSSLEIEVDVGESYIKSVFAGQNTIATLDAYPNWQIKSKVVAVIPTADRQKASIKVRVKLLESDQRIFPDMGVKVSFLKS